MKKIKIIVDSCSSIPKDIAIKNDIDILAVNFTINDELIDPTNTKITVDEFFDKLTKKVDMKTSAIAPNVYFEAFEKYIKDDYQVIYISLSSGLSCGYQNSLLAKSMIIEEYPNAIVECIDTLSGSIGVYFTIKEAIKLINDGLDAKTIKDRLDKNGLNIESLFTIGSLYHLYKGGRLRLATAAAGLLLRIKPLVIADEFGKLKSSSVQIGKKRALASMALRVADNVLDDEIFIGYTNNLDEANYFEKLLLEKNSNLKITKCLIDFTMMCHCGPETVAVFYKKKNFAEKF